MGKKNLIGKKVRGFRFDATDSGLLFVYEMTKYNGRIGTIIDIDEDDVRVEFEDGKKFQYPLDQIEQHLVEETPSQYEVGMTVYDILHEGEGNIISIGDSEMYPVKVDFGGDISTYTKDGRNTITARYPLLSLTPYDLVNGGATFPTFKPKVPEIEKGTLVYVRDDPDSYWGMRFFSHFDEHGVMHCYMQQDKEGKTQPWPEYSLTSPLIEENQEDLERETAANSRLIAAAPEMLDMLQKALNRINKMLIWADIPAEDRRQYKKDIEALIKKATEQ